MVTCPVIDLRRRLMRVEAERQGRKEMSKGRERELTRGPHD